MLSFAAEPNTKSGLWNPLAVSTKTRIFLRADPLKRDVFVSDFQVRINPAGLKQLFLSKPASSCKSRTATAPLHKLQQQLDTVNAAIQILGGKNGDVCGKKRHFSASARAKMSRAQKARWAKLKAGKKGA